MYRWRGGGRFTQPAVQLSVLQLVRSGTLDLKLAALLWLIMEQRASVLVAAGPSFAGKTTTLNVLLDFLPPAVRQVNLRSYGEDFGFLRNAKPEETYLVGEEFSNHGFYIWGEVAQKAFNLLTQGYSVGGTIHARTAKEALLILNQALGLPASVLGQLGAIVMLHAWMGLNEPVRHIDEVSVIMPLKDGIGIQTIAAREVGADAFAFAEDEVLQRSLSDKFHMVDVDVKSEIDKRSKLLGQLLSEGKIFQDQVKQAIVDFNAGRHP